MAKNEKFRYSIISALEHNKDGSYATQSDRRRILMNVSKDLVSCGFNQVTDRNYGGKHAHALVQKWQCEGLAVATIKNRLSHLRWLAEKLGKPTAIVKDNSRYGVADRVYSDNSKNKAKDIDETKVSRLTERQKLSTLLQREFGLRREESLKFQPSLADREDKIVLKGSWCKGGRTREIPVLTERQRQLLDRCHVVVGNGSMIDDKYNYVQAMKAYEKACERANLRNVHGHRHMYAQERYKEITGRDCPKSGGQVSKKLNQDEKNQDYKARMIISSELGHGREEITVNYLGR